MKCKLTNLTKILCVTRLFLLIMQVVQGNEDYY